MGVAEASITVVEQVFADCSTGPWLTSGSFPANAAWLVLTVAAHNLLRAAGALANPPAAELGQHPACDLIDVATRIARHGRGLIVRW